MDLLSKFSTEVGGPLKKQKLGRPKIVSKADAFQMAIDYLGENDDETITRNDLYDVMNIKSGLTYDDIYSKTYMKQKLIDHYGQKVSITTIRQKKQTLSH